MTSAEIKALRKRAWHYMLPDPLNAAGMTLHQMQQFIAGNFTPSDVQLRQLWQRMDMDRR